MIYRFKIWFEDVEDVYRWIDIHPSSTFFEFHSIIQESIGFDNKELSSFFVSDDKWRQGMEILLEDMDMDEKDEPKALMKKSKIKDFVNDPHQKFIYLTDYVANWLLNIELQGIFDEAPKKEYPLVFKSEGKAPKQREDNRFKILDDNEMDELAQKILMAKGAKNIMEGSEEELVNAAAEEEEEEENDEFGFNEFGAEEDNLDGFEINKE